MGIEKSIIVDSFQNEGEHVEHLIDKVMKMEEQEKDILLTRNNTSEGRCEVFNWEESDETDERYEMHIERYQQWVEENPIKHKLFVAWIDINAGRNHHYDYYFFIKNFLEWERDEPLHIKQLQDYYEDYYPRIYSYFEWKSTNFMEDVLRQPRPSYFNDNLYSITDLFKLPKCVVLIKEVEDYEHWIKCKKEYEQWGSKFDYYDIELEVFIRDVSRIYFNGNENAILSNRSDYSIKQIHEIITKQLETETEDIKDMILDWFDNNPNEACELYVHICCVKRYQIKKRKDLLLIDNIFKEENMKYEQWSKQGYISDF